MAKLNEQQRAFLASPFVATVTTLRSDGSPHNTIVWMDTDGDTVRFNTAEGRAKPEHLRNDPRVAITVLDPQNAMKWISVTGRAKLTTEGADAHIDKLAKKYLGEEVYPWRNPAEQRVTVTIEPELIDATGIE